MKNDIQKLLESFGENSRIGDVLHAYEMHLSQCSIPASMVHAQKYYDGQNATRLKIIKLWSYSDLTKSLNSILSEAEWEENMIRKIHVCIPIKKALELLKAGESPLTGAPSEQLVELTKAQSEGKEYFCGCDNQENNGSCAGHVQEVNEVPKQPHIRELFQFLLQLGL